MTKVTVSSKGQIAIPKAIREKMHLKQGSKLLIRLEGSRLIAETEGLEDWRTMQGMAKGGLSLTKFLEKEHAAEITRDEARAVRIQ